MANNRKAPMRATYAKLVGQDKDGKNQYKNLPTMEDASNINVHRNDATVKQFEAQVAELAELLAPKGFRLQEISDKKRALFVRSMSQTVDELKAQLA
jgi:hypothetical protein